MDDTTTSSGVSGSTSTCTLENDTRNDAATGSRATDADDRNDTSNHIIITKEKYKSLRRTSFPTSLAKFKTSTTERKATTGITKEEEETTKDMGTSRRASFPVIKTTVELSEFVRLDKDQRKETLTALEPQQIEDLFVQSSRKLLAKKASLQKQLSDLHARHDTEMRRVKEQLKYANQRLKQRVIVHADRQTDHQSTHQTDHHYLHQAIVDTQTTPQSETRSMVQVVDEYAEQADDATYFAFQVMMLMAVGIAAVWAAVCDTGTTESVNSWSSLWMFAA